MALDISKFINNANNQEQQVKMFFGKLFMYSSLSKLLHLSVNSYAQHKALQELYESINNLVDDLVESYQTEKIIQFNIPEAKISNSAIIEVNNMLSWIRANRNIFTYSFQQNIIDEIEQSISSTLYKLKFLQ
jgi:hypothetical protein